jgi:prepilin-type N-terminal cleavage/methylation domain-containing protein
MHSSLRGFTLIELSIVLIVIGLVIGGVLIGNDLIENRLIQKQIARLSEVEMQINTFRNKYKCLPGDCANATRFFGKHSGALLIDCNADTAAEGSPGTCNGNGNGIIGDVTTYESYYFDSHLVLAKFSSVQIDSTWTITRPNDSFLGTEQHYTYDNDDWWPTSGLNRKNWAVTATNTSKPAGILYRLDNKIDDGQGFSGRMKIVPEEIDTSDLATCIDGTGAYRTTGATTNYCHVWFNLNF